MPLGSTSPSNAKKYLGLSTIFVWVHVVPPLCDCATHGSPLVGPFQLT